MKKLLTIFTSISLIASPTSYVISCKPPEPNDPDYYIPELTNQPKNIKEIETLAGKAQDKKEEYLEISTIKWKNYMESIDNWDILSDDEKLQHNINFSLNSKESQKQYIYMFWLTTYNYKIYQFDQEYSRDFESPNHYKVRLRAKNLESYTFQLEDLYLNDEFTSQATKNHIEKIYQWGIQDNPYAPENN